MERKTKREREREREQKERERDIVRGFPLFIATAFCVFGTRSRLVVRVFTPNNTKAGASFST